MTVKDYRVEVSQNDTNWNLVYSGTVPATDYYTKKCTYEPVICKHIRLKILSTYDNRGYTWAQIKNCKVYGTIMQYKLSLSNDNMYGML